MMHSSRQNNTEQLIDTLSAQLTPLPTLWRYDRAFLFMPLLAALLAVFVLIVASQLGLRPDLQLAITAPAYLLKVGLVVLCAGIGAVAFWHSRRPTLSFPKRYGLLPLGVACYLIIQAWATTMAAPTTNALFNGSGFVCLAYVSGLSIMPLAAGLLYLRKMAPTQPAWAGFWAGLASAGLAATAYALHCPYDQASYVVMWYMPALLLPALIGSVAGRHLLRW
jgi:hypothetical protein